MSSAVGAFLTVFQPPGREVLVGEGDGGVAEHGVDAGRLVLLGVVSQGGSCCSRSIVIGA